MLSAGYVARVWGEADIRLLCTKFGTGFREVKHAFREYRNTRGATIPPAIRDMINCVSTIPVSTAECERGFSKMWSVVVCEPAFQFPTCSFPSVALLYICVSQWSMWSLGWHRTGGLLTACMVRNANPHLLQPGQPVPCGMLCELRWTVHTWCNCHSVFRCILVLNHCQITLLFYYTVNCYIYFWYGIQLNMPRCFIFANSGLALVGYLWTQNCLDPHCLAGVPLWIQRAPIISI